MTVRDPQWAADIEVLKDPLVMDRSRRCSTYGDVVMVCSCFMDIVDGRREIDDERVRSSGSEQHEPNVLRRVFGVLSAESTLLPAGPQHASVHRSAMAKAWCLTSTLTKH